jgi:DNA polymerase-3 subunit beta
MKFSVLQDNLAKGINTVTRAIPTKAALPILSNILISAEDDRLKLAATNMDTTIITHVNASVQKEGAITVPAKIIKDFITNLSPGTVKAALKNDILQLESENSKSKINGINSEDYPELPETKKIKKFLEFDPKEFNNTISLVSFASGADESRPVFTGILLKKEGAKLVIASTDGFRLSEKILKTDKSFDDFQVIIPAKTMSEVARIFAAQEEKIKFSLNENENLAIFSTDETFVATRILDGEYPDYTKIIPKDSVLKVALPYDEFIEAVKLTQIFSSEDDSALVIRFYPEGSIKVASLSDVTGEHESSIMAEVDGETLEIAFGIKYLMDFLNNIKSNTISFSTSGNVAPCVLKTEDHEEYIHIIMPRQI